MSRYFSRELTKHSIEVLNKDPQHLELAQLLTGVMVLRALDDPDGKDVMITYTFEEGRCVDWVFESEPAPSTLRDRPFVPMKDGIARVTANYSTFVKLDKEELEPADTLDSPDYKIEGHKLMFLPLMQSMDSWNRVVRRIPKEY